MRRDWIYYIFALCVAVVIGLLVQQSLNRHDGMGVEKIIRGAEIVGGVYYTAPPILTASQIAEIEYYDSLELLAICVEAEAGNQDLKGRQLVADVILNRVDSERFPDTIEEVISQPPCQFTSYWDGGMDSVVEPSPLTFEAVQRELEGREDTEILFFTEGKYNPYCEPLYKYGAHYFGR